MIKHPLPARRSRSVCACVNVCMREQGRQSRDGERVRLSGSAANAAAAAAAVAVGWPAKEITHKFYSRLWPGRPLKGAHAFALSLIRALPDWLAVLAHSRCYCCCRFRQPPGNYRTRPSCMSGTSRGGQLCHMKTLTRTNPTRCSFVVSVQRSDC